MKMRILLPFIAMAAVATAYAQPKAFYVVKGNSYTKYSLGVAENMRFADNGHKLIVDGYGESINLDDIDYISLTAPVSTSLTSSEQKQKLVDIGKEAISMINLNDNSDIANMCHAFFDDRGYVDGVWIHGPSEYNLPNEYWDVHKHVRALLKSFNKMVNGNVAEARTVKSETVSIYRLVDHNGIYTANAATNSWDKVDADHIEIRFTGFNGENYSVVIKSSSEETAWATCDFDLKFPKKVEISLVKNGNSFASATLETNLVPDKSIDVTLDCDANQYVVHDVMSVTNTEINDVATASVKGKELCRSTAHIDGKNLVKYDDMREAVKEATHYHDEEGNCCGEDGGPLTAHFIRANVNADVIGKLQISAKLNGFSKLNDILSEDCDIDELSLGNNRYILYPGGKIISNKGGYYITTDCDKNIIDKQINAFNSYCDIKFSYDGTDDIQGYLNMDYDEDSWDAYDYSDEYYAYTEVNGYLVLVQRNSESQPWSYTIFYCDDHGDFYESEEVEVDASKVVHPAGGVSVSYEIVPVIVFPDQTSFYFEDFFDEDSFKGLIDDCSDLVDTYYTITGQEHDDD